MKEVIEIQSTTNEFSVFVNGKPTLVHKINSPMLYVGTGKSSVQMYRGNFDISDYIEERIPLRKAVVSSLAEGIKVSFSETEGTPVELEMEILKKDIDRIDVTFNKKEESNNERCWIRVAADEEEKIYGCGEQLSYFNLRGKNFPLWTSEPGVGRNKETYTTWQADVKDRAGGDYYTTNYPQPTFVSTNKYFLHLSTTAYADFDFSHKDFHELHTWEVPESLQIVAGSTYLELVEKMSEVFGTQPELPEWTYNGIWLGIQGGTEVVEQKLETMLQNDVKVGAVWCQDWQGKRITSFGKRLMWNWIWDKDMYPNLDQKIWEWKEQGIRFLGYINPYVAKEGHLYKEAKEKGYLATKEDGSDYLVDFGEFYCGVVDFTNPQASEWFKEVIQTNLIDFGLDGWMADFGEYLPTDVKLYDGSDPMKMHNLWPTLWGSINRKAIEERETKDDLVYFMRAGYTGIQKECPLLWGGDQSVIWEKDDGLASVIPAALSSGMTGCGLHHSDIGGYTSLHGNKRSKELLLRWVEMAAFTPVMRTHEGNRPDDCFQFDGDEETIKQFAKMTKIYTELAPYIRKCVKENAEKGIPVQRPLFMHYEQDQISYDIKYQYLLGKDLLVAPVYEQGKSSWEVYLPEDKWVHLWTGDTYSGGHHEVRAPIGHPPVFYRSDSSYRELFESFKLND
ncbi:alpha-glucosidase [Salipaludibacillus keqinensis]|uniref:Alpha-glucosidase n=1 Tax=Salipaludibacillus keqinensis TaxID=2045207 RepID=A0A323TBL1_9BACI|nr:alpha-glucosidase [Salipaludibacillus keqinensis]PYZ92618.1 alpha-glucosidase [Salipaludibacillus keqinensis]